MLSNAETIWDLEGPFVVAGGSGGIGVVAGIDVNVGKDRAGKNIVVVLLDNEQGMSDTKRVTPGEKGEYNKEPCRYGYCIYCSRLTKDDCLQLLQANRDNELGCYDCKLDNCLFCYTNLPTAVK